MNKTIDSGLERAFAGGQRADGAVAGMLRPMGILGDMLMPVPSWKDYSFALGWLAGRAWAAAARRWKKSGKTGGVRRKKAGG